MADAHYLHRTVYQFNKEQGQEIIERFNADVQDVAARCSYDSEEAVFHVTCPTYIGLRADEALNTAISEYVERKYAAAEREDRPLDIQRPHESDFDDFDLHQEEPAALIAPASSSNYPAKAPVLLIWHAVTMDLITSGALKLFRLRDLPGDVLERTLVPNTNVRSRRAVQWGLTCRVTRWDPSSNDYIFNGRLGAPLAMGDQMGESLLENNTIVELADLRLSAVPFRREERGLTASWKFTEETPTIQQFLEGMGKTEQEAHDQPSEAPADALRFLACPDNQPQPLGRTRIPKGFALPPNTEGSSDERTEEFKADEKKAAFDRLLKNYDDNETCSEDSFQMSDNHTDADDGKVTFKTLLSKSVGRSKSQTQQPSILSLVQNGTQQGLPRVQPPPVVPWPSLPARSNKDSLPPTFQDEASSGQAESIRKHQRSDRDGPSFRAAGRAQWNIQHEPYQLQKTRKSGIRLRQASETWSPPPSSGSSSSVSLDKGPDLQHFPRPDTHAPLDSSLSQPNHQPWLNKAQHAYSRSHVLTDSVPQYQVPVNSLPGQDLTSKLGQRDQLHMLSDFNSGSKASPCVPKARPGNQVLERFRTDREPPEDMKWAVPQHEHKRLRGSIEIEGTAFVSDVTSLNFDPILPPNPSTTSENLQSHRYLQPQSDNPAESENIGQAESESESESAEMKQHEEDESLAYSPHVAKFFQEIMSCSGREEIDIDVHFGLILVHHKSNKAFHKEADYLDAERLQTKLQDATEFLQTDFFPRLTTSDADAHFMLNMIPDSEVQSRVLYEIIIKNSEGHTRVIRFDQDARDAFVIDPESTIGQLHWHYPIRVWDAQVVVRSSIADQSMTDTVHDFLQTIQTIGDAPSFHAMIPYNSFAVERVYIKRIFSKNEGGIEHRVTEVQDLQLESMNDASYNLKAVAWPLGTMVAEHRLWWESSLHVRSADELDVGRLQEIVPLLLGQMDGVGYGNRGPWERDAGKEQEEAISFW